jgi:hypothetical protein
MAGNSSWDQADGKNLVWFGELERKFSQIIKDYFHLPFFLLIILWYHPIRFASALTSFKLKDDSNTMTAHNNRKASNSRNESNNRTANTVWTPLTLSREALGPIGPSVFKG